MYNQKQSQPSQHQPQDLLNQARIQDQLTFSSSQSSFKTNNSHKTNNNNKSLSLSNSNSQQTTTINQYDFRSSISLLLDKKSTNNLKDSQNDDNSNQFMTPKGTAFKNITFDKTKTVNIVGKNGRLYKDICPICLVQFDKQKGILECQHIFCFQCILQWSKTSTACPCCRTNFTKITKNTNNKGSNQKQSIKVQQKRMQFNQDDYFICYTCGRGDNQHVLLICDGCDFYSCHIFCDPQLNNQIPQGQWYCKFCVEKIRKDQEIEENIGNLSMSTISVNFTQEKSEGQLEQAEEEQQKEKQQQQYHQQQIYNKPVAARTRSRNQPSNLRVLKRLRRRNN